MTTAPFVSAPAAASGMAKTIRITRPGDSKLDCMELSREISYMDEVISEAEDTKRSTKITGTGIGVVETIGSFAIGSLGGVLGIFAAGALVSNMADNKVEALHEIQTAASLRRSLMTAMHEVRQCHGPLAQELAVLEPAAGDEDEVDLMGPPDLRPPKPVYND